MTERPQAKWRRQKPGNERPGAGVPVWGTMVDWEAFQFAQKVTPYVQFLHPGIIRALVQDNRLMRPDWSCRLQALGIDPEVYLWDLFRIRNKSHYSGCRIIPDLLGQSVDRGLFDSSFPQ